MDLCRIDVALTSDRSKINAAFTLDSRGFEIKRLKSSPLKSVDPVTTVSTWLLLLVPKSILALSCKGKNLKRSTAHKNEILKMSLCSEATSIQRLGEGERNKYIYNPQFFLPVNAAMALITTSANILVLSALHKDSSLHPPSKLLFRCLAATGLCVGLVSQPLFVVYLMAVSNMTWSICGITEGLAYISTTVLCGESIITLTVISVDRLLALLLGLRYRQVVTLVRVRLFLFFSWIMILVGSFTFLWNKSLFFIGSSACNFLFLGISSCCYSKIYLTLRHRQAQIRVQAHRNDRVASGVNIARYKKTLSTALWIHSALLFCYLPYTITSAVTGTLSLSFSNTAVTGFVVVFFNSMLNPFLYCWRVRAVREAVKQTIRNVFCC